MVPGLLSLEKYRQIERAMKVPVEKGESVLYQGITASAFERDYRYKRLIGRTMFETDRLPMGWADACNAMDEVWVPSRFNAETFIRAGVAPEKVKLVPAGVDTEEYRPGLVPLEIPGRRKFTFLSIFEWSYRKGWDVLLRAIASQFHRDDDVAFIIKTSTRYSPTADPVGEMIALLEGQMQKRLEDLPPIILLSGYLSAQELCRLYASADAFVLPTRGEGYGRPFMEAMSCGLPVIATRWSGQLDFMHEGNSYLVDVESMVPVTPVMDQALYAGHMWAEPSVDHLAELMGRVVRDPDEAKRKGGLARQEMVRDWDWRVIGHRFVQEVQRVTES
ncbi:MAG: glycosyltransferase family 4 protein [Bacillota bacterium]